MQQGGKYIKNYKIGSVKTRFYYDIQQGNACLSGSASRKTKRRFKRIAAQATRNLIKRLTRHCHEES